MARNTTPAAATREVPANEKVIAEEVNSANQLASVMRLQNDLQANYGEERDLLNQLLGQAQMAGAFEEFSRTVRTSKLAFVKESKLYQQLKGKKTPHGAELLGNWEEFCNLLGRSVDQVDRDIANLKAFGEEALESMSRMGIGYRELRQYRKLPEDQKLALLEVAKTGDKSEFLDLAEELIARHAKEKADLSQQLEESAKEHEATAKRLEVVTGQKVEAEAKAARIAVMTPDKSLADLQTKATKISNTAAGAIKGEVRQALLKLNEMPPSASRTVFAAGLLGTLQAEINALREEFGLPDIASAAERELAADTQAWAGGGEAVEA
ncbi:hypothetical protein [Comamonas sp. E6]|uniref:hypothetical protein n=1 Tax=Comamonas sp. E6 TaxID=364029 RepID=UPI0006345A8A|nr:hypothetical protein [Comamonas sp. E6]GAO70978.1 hypothetical protein CSE6_013_24150 [Comamonas sp. E6]